MGNLQDKVNTIHGRTKNLFSEFGNVAPRVLILGLDGAGMFLHQIHFSVQIEKKGVMRVVHKQT